MQNDVQKLERFKEAVLKEISAEIDTKVVTAKKESDTILSTANDMSLEESFQYVNRETKAIKDEYKRKVSRRSFEIIREALLYRSNMIENFFEEIKAKVVDFTNEEKYNLFLQRTFTSMDSEKPFYKGVTVYYRSCDEKFVKKLAIALPQLEFSADKDIKMGGIAFFYPKEIFFVDKTLDSALKREKEAFSKNIQMQI